MIFASFFFLSLVGRMATRLNFRNFAASIKNNKNALRVESNMVKEEVDFSYFRDFIDERMKPRVHSIVTEIRKSTCLT